ncbi:SDR family NAD(P)-dependent oxidoreductase [Teichococcus vastitatis]|jgi:short-subunit dehydrogenase|uniref:SDR family NAD(P)-dependent oxidoreductase n=1 Tax=Teichococcus vastitatis TaxID=2307076 RepID=A0ABS9WB12_9PROT|nr:SDR family NAD(P)-dependent oxidoreductase [Pseudoroseomonas vastitatis]MCI0756484.1 SDR family NAD(P)-dependent oxidoreductase [Pseudoroseomonas vastitatis]
MTRGFRSAVISGASRGLGAALALRLAAPGVTLGLIGRDAAALAAVAAACAARGATPRLGVLDVREAEAMSALLRDWDAACPVDLVVANAGIAHGTRPDGGPEGPAAVRAQLEVNLLGALNLVEPLLPAMRRRGGGGIGLVASLAALRGLPDSPGYCASKAGLWAYGQALRAALAPEGLRVTLVAPGFFDSAMGRRYRGDRPFSMSADAAAARIEAALRRGAAELAFPWPLFWALRLSPLLPAALVDRLVRRMRFRVDPAE